MEEKLSGYIVKELQEEKERTKHRYRDSDVWKDSWKREYK